MDKQSSKSATEKIKAVFRDIVGLPPGDRTPHGEGRPIKPGDARRGSLTADDAEGLPTPSGTGISVQ